MDIDEFRKKYPEYNDMSDRALADALYSKHYSDLPREQFDKKFLGGKPLQQNKKLKIAEVQLPDGRIVELEVPEGTSEQQIIDFVSQQDFSGGGPQGNQGASGQWGRGASGKWHDSEAEYMVDQMGQPERFVTGIGKGMTDVGQGIKQIGLQAGEAVGLVPQGRTAEYTRQIKSDEQQFDQPLLGTTEGKVGRFAGQMVATLPVSLPFGGPAATVGGRALQGAGIGALSSGVMPVEEGGSRLQNALIGAGIGAF